MASVGRCDAHHRAPPRVQHLHDVRLVRSATLPELDNRDGKIIVGWIIAFFEYCFAVPANRVGYAQGFTGGQLKIIQEIITLSVFAVFAMIVLKEPFTWRYAGAFLCIAGAAAFMFVGRP